MTGTAPEAQTLVSHADRRPWLALGLTALSVTAYLLVLVVPWLAAGAPDPASPQLAADEQVWSYPTALGPVIGLLAFWAFGVAPFASVGVAAWSAHRLWTTRAVPVRRSMLWAALLVSVATFAWFLLQGAALLVWVMD